MWKKIQNYFSLTADLLQIVGFFGLTPAIVLTVTCGILGWISQIPAFYLFISVVGTLAISVYLTRGVAVRIGTIPLSQGARIAYEQLRGTLWAVAAERGRVDSSPEGILDYLATGISAEIPIYGRFPPSTKLERVSDVEVRSGSIKEGGRVLQLRDLHRSQYVDLTVRKRDLRKAIRVLKTS